MPRIRNSRSHTLNAPKVEQNADGSILSNRKQDIIVEKADIGGFTLIFKDPEKENKWHKTHRKRHIGITSRYLFVCALFQGLFFCKASFMIVNSKFT